jgi:hypothetical protein
MSDVTEHGVEDDLAVRVGQEGDLRRRAEDEQRVDPAVEQVVHEPRQRSGVHREVRCQGGDPS